jgi:RimJ/RimL family protein N-acetyltransferase
MRCRAKLVFLRTMLAHLFHIDTVLLSTHTVIRRFRENDGEAFYELLDNNRSRIEELLGLSVSEINSKEVCEAFVRRKLSEWLLQQSYAFGIWDSNGGKPIGYVELFRIDWSVPKACIVFFIDRAYENKGIMTEVIREIGLFAFSQLNMERIELYTASDNFPAHRLGRKCGFRREGDLRAFFRKPSGELLDAMLLVLTR